MITELTCILFYSVIIIFIIIIIIIIIFSTYKFQNPSLQGSILEDFENASMYIGYILLKNFLKVEWVYKINIVSCTPTQ